MDITIADRTLDLSTDTGRLVAADALQEAGRDDEARLLRTLLIPVRVCRPRGLGDTVCERPRSNETRHRELRQLFGVQLPGARTLSARMDLLPDEVWDKSILDTRDFIEQCPGFSVHAEVPAEVHEYARQFAERFAEKRIARCPSAIRRRTRGAVIGPVA